MTGSRASILVRSMAVTLLLLVLGGTYLAAQWWQSREQQITWLPAAHNSAKACELSQSACRATDGERLIAVSSDSDVFAPDTAFSVEVTLEQLEADVVWLQLEGITMYMGVSRYRLERQPDGKYAMSLRVPTCSEQRMRWQGKILVERSEQPVYGQRFEFEAVKR